MVIGQTSKCLALDLDFSVAGLLCGILNLQNPHIQVLLFSYQQVTNTLDIDKSFFSANCDYIFKQILSVQNNENKT